MRDGWLLDAAHTLETCFAGDGDLGRPVPDLARISKTNRHPRRRNQHETPTLLLIPALLAAAPVAADTLAAVKEKGTRVFGLEAQYKPFEFRDENNEIIG